MKHIPVSPTKAAAVPTGAAAPECDFSKIITGGTTIGNGDEVRTGPERFGEPEQMGPIRTTSVYSASDA